MPSPVGVFEVTAPIEDLGARVGDRLVIGRGEVWPVALARNLPVSAAKWAIHSDAARLLFALSAGERFEPGDLGFTALCESLREDFPHLHLVKR
ncbi:MAG TPA: hypothetical protein VMN39_07635 [Longimicrobiaceae bacterium]|nr:hypothetical protein [Longimicrobiaceae bacterium]